MSHQPRFSKHKSIPSILITNRVVSISAVGLTRSKSEIKLALNHVNSDKKACVYLSSFLRSLIAALKLLASEIFMRLPKRSYDHILYNAIQFSRSAM